VGASFVTKRVLDTTSDTIVRLQIWDTAGQERFRSISRLYYRGANAGLLCYDITDERSFQEMAGWLVELKQNLGEDNPIVIHVVGTKSDIVADDPSKRKVPFERTIAYVAEQLYPSQASTPPPSSGVGVLGTSGGAFSTQPPESKRSSGFWGQDIGWDCCHEVSAKDGEGIEEVFRVITRKLVEQRNKKLEAEAMQRGLTVGVDGVAAAVEGTSSDGTGSVRGGNADKRRSWLGFPPALVMGEEVTIEPAGAAPRSRSRCC
jgi:GTPase SAR1 family protein